MIDPRSVEKVLIEMVSCAMRNQAPTQDELGSWIQELSQTALSVHQGKRDDDNVPSHLTFGFTVNRATIELSCCIPHAVGPLFRGAWTSLEEEIDKACWRVPADNPRNHRPKAKH